MTTTTGTRTTSVPASWSSEHVKVCVVGAGGREHALAVALGPTADVTAKLSGATFGDAGRRVVIEEFLDGPEVSLLCVCDGRTAVPLAPAQDFKRLADGDAGPNTGGMGAFSPVPVAGPEVVA